MEACGGQLVATISLKERCLVVYPAPEWRRIEEALQGLPTFDDKAQKISRLLIGHASECDMDAQGRILVPPTLRDLIGLDKRVRMLGQVSKFELWDEDHWAQRRQELLAQAGELLTEPSEALRSLVL
jgi:MraZ protein